VTVFLAAAMVATSVGVTSELLMEQRALGTSSGRVILGAAVIDDVLAMIILATATGIAAGGVSIERIALLVLVALGFIGVVVVGGTGVLRRRPSLLTEPVFARTPFLPGMIIMLGFRIHQIIFKHIVGTDHDNQINHTGSHPLHDSIRHIGNLLSFVLFLHFGYSYCLHLLVTSCSLHPIPYFRKPL
jgi:Kef-type K+ transport system membrane component KefB